MNEDTIFSEKPFFVCSLCECDPAVHCYFQKCLLLENELICVDCCLEDVPNDKVISKLKEIGIELTRQDIDTICKKCNKRCVGDTK